MAVSSEKAKEVISDFLLKHDGAGLISVASELDLDLKLTVEAVQELVREGKVEVGPSGLHLKG